MFVIMRFSKKVGFLDDAMEEKAIPMIPLEGVPRKSSDGLLTAPKYWFLTVSPATVTVSCASVPCASPESYVIVKLWLSDLNVLDFCSSNVAISCGMLELEPEPVDATQRSDEPVSRMTLNETGGVPIASDPK